MFYDKAQHSTDVQLQSPKLYWGAIGKQNALLMCYGTAQRSTDVMWQIIMLYRFVAMVKHNAIPMCYSKTQRSTGVL